MHSWRLKLLPWLANPDIVNSVIRISWIHCFLVLAADRMRNVVQVFFLSHVCFALLILIRRNFKILRNATIWFAFFASGAKVHNTWSSENCFNQWKKMNKCQRTLYQRCVVITDYQAWFIARSVSKCHICMIVQKPVMNWAYQLACHTNCCNLGGCATTVKCSDGL